MPNLFCRPLAAIVLVASAIAPAQAATAPQTFLEQGLQEIIKIAESNRGATPVQLARKTRPALERLFNFESLTKRAIGGGWRDLNPAQQKQAISLFSEMLIRSYAARFDWDAKLEMQLSPPVDVGSGRIEIPAQTRYAGSKANVLYRLENTAGRWSVYDVVIEGVSMTANYRAQFDSIRQRSGGEGLLKLMKDTLDKGS